MLTCNGAPQSHRDAFLDGMYRVAKPIVSNPNYKDILGTRIDEFLQRHQIRADRSRSSVDQATAILDRTLVRKRLRFHPLPPATAVAYGGTRNNLREFAFLRDFLQRWNLQSQLFNVGYLQAERNKRLSECGDLIPRIRSGFRQFVEESGGIEPPTLVQLVNYVHAYVSWTVCLRDSQSIPRVAVFANDHSPHQVACSMVSRNLNIPRIYIQHAEVTRAFPPLDFEISLLRNRASMEVYEEIGGCSGAAYIVGRETTPFDIERFASAIAGPICVGVYLTAQVDWEGLAEVVSRLRTNPAIDTLFIKPHPSQSSQQIYEVCPGVSVFREIPESAHVAVVANSSVVVELLHRGNPVLQYYGMDSVPADYYGFSRMGVAPALRLEDMATPFWEKFCADESWLDAFRRFDPSADPLSHEQEALLAEALAAHFPQAPPTATAVGWGRASHAMHGEGFLRSLITAVPNTVIDVVNEGLLRTPWATSVDRADFTTATESLFADRVPAAYDVFAATRRVRRVQSDFVFNGKRRDIELSGRSTSEYELDELTQYQLQHAGDSSQRWRKDVQFMLLLLRLGEERRFCEFSRQIPPLPMKNLHINNRIAIVKWLRNRPLMQAATGLVPAQFYQGLSPFHRLKLRILSSSDQVFDSDPWTHSEVEEAFRATISDGLRADFEQIFKPAYDRLRERLVLMDVRWAKEERRQFFDLVRSALAEQRPFSLVRMSDGEGYVYADGRRFFTTEDMRNRERHWWREELTDEHRSRLIPEIRAAADNADVLGIPSVYRLLRDNSDKSRSLLDSLQGRGLSEVILAASESAPEWQVFSEEKCNLPLFSDIRLILDLVASANRLVVVASAQPQEVSKLFSDSRHLEYIQIPTHSRTLGNSKYGASPQSLPHVYPSIRESVVRIVEPGDLVLVAAGVAGKIFINDAKQAGGVALDIGSSFDEWVGAGIHSLY